MPTNTYDAIIIGAGHNGLVTAAYLAKAGYKVLVFTSAFTDWMIADQVARGLGLPSPARTKRGVMFLEWLAVTHPNHRTNSSLIDKTRS